MSPAGAQPLGEFTVVCYVIVGTTTSGEPTGPNVVAVDPSVIPLHTNLWIESVGYRTALDIGGGVKGNTLDLWMTWPDCKQFGKQHLNVYISVALALRPRPARWIVGSRIATCRRLPHQHCQSSSRPRPCCGS